MPTNERIVSIVDDEFHTAQLFYEALSENIDEISVFSFTDPIKALEHFTENKEDYALVISDLRMPGLNGLELLKKVKDSNPKVRTILMSAYNFEEHIRAHPGQRIVMLFDMTDTGLRHLVRFISKVCLV